LFFGAHAFSQSDEKKKKSEEETRLAGDYLDQGKYAEALSTLQEAISQNPNNSEAYFWIGYANMALKKSDEAITAFESAIALKENDRNNHLYVAICYVDKGDNSKAEANLQRAYEIDPNDPTVLNKISTFYLFTMKSTETALPYLMRSAEKD
jgi:tetratricopeptide (TPR) repeat protein